MVACHSQENTCHTYQVPCRSPARPPFPRPCPLHTTHRAVHLPSLARWIMRSSANSAQMVLPLPVGAATSAESSVLYRAVNTWGGGGRMRNEGWLVRAREGAEQVGSSCCCSAPCLYACLPALITAAPLPAPPPRPTCVWMGLKCVNCLYSPSNSGFLRQAGRQGGRARDEEGRGVTEYARQSALLHRAAASQHPFRCCSTIRPLPTPNPHTRT